MRTEQTITVSLDEDLVRFTPDGRISVLDAIKALTLTTCPDILWENLKKTHPEILAHCEDHHFQKGLPLPVIDSDGWNIMWVLLMEYMLEPDKYCS